LVAPVVTLEPGRPDGERVAPGSVFLVSNRAPDARQAIEVRASVTGGGRAVSSFDIRPGGGVQKFPLPPAAGKGAWIRIAAQPGASETIIGDMKLITTAEQ
jgi:hypothetical protein